MIVHYVAGRQAAFVGLCVSSFRSTRPESEKPMGEVVNKDSEDKKDREGAVMEPETFRLPMGEFEVGTGTGPAPELDIYPISGLEPAALRFIKINSMPEEFDPYDQPRFSLDRGIILFSFDGKEFGASLGETVRLSDENQITFRAIDLGEGPVFEREPVRTLPVYYATSRLEDEIPSLSLEGEGRKNKIELEGQGWSEKERKMIADLYVRFLGGYVIWLQSRSEKLFSGNVNSVLDWIDAAQRTPEVDVLLGKIAEHGHAETIKNAARNKLQKE